MLRYPSLWIGSLAGHRLAALVGGMTLFTALVGGVILRSALRSTQSITLPPSRPAGKKALVVSLSISAIGLLVLALYPDTWRQTVAGALLTVGVGALLLMVTTWAWALALAPYRETKFQDVLDDVASMYRWLKAHTGRIVVWWRLLDNFADTALVRSVWNWLNPRKHAWHLVLLLALFMGVALVSGEIIGEGAPEQLGRLALVVAVFLTLEGLAVLLGYALLAKPLRLFRHETEGAV